MNTTKEIRFRVVCLHCRQERIDGIWQDNDYDEDDLISHGICDKCFELIYGPIEDTETE